MTPTKISMKRHFNQLTFSEKRVSQILTGREVSESRNRDTKSGDRSLLYLESYPALLSLAQDRSMQPSHLQVALCLAVYGWMPTIPSFISRMPFVETARRIKSHKDAQEFITRLERPLVNRSWVGTSKVLHFLCPVHFAIWDSKIARKIEGKHKGENVAANNKSKYRTYLESLHDIDASYPNLGNPLADEVTKSFGYRPSNLRCLEMHLFAD